MTRRKGLKSPIEDALRKLADRRGPSVGRLVGVMADAGEDDPLVHLTRAVGSMPRGDDRERAGALWALIQEEIAAIGIEVEDPRCHAALRAAFRLDLEAYRGIEYDSIDRRLRAAADAAYSGSTSLEALRQAWSDGVYDLAQRVQRRLATLEAAPLGWTAYLPADDPKDGRHQPPAGAQPVTLSRLVGTYTVHGRTVKYGVTERTIHAEADGVDHYDVRARVLPGADSNIVIRPLLNCAARAGDLRRVRDESGTRFVLPVYSPNPLAAGDTWFMATQVIHQDHSNDLPLIGITVTSHGIRPGGLTLRVQFEQSPLPTAIWWYADCVVDDERWRKPPEGAPQRLDDQVTGLGFLEWNHPAFCHPGLKYGIAWEWPSAE